MAKARALDKRRKSIRNIRKITRTMELIATARVQEGHGPGPRGHGLHPADHRSWWPTWPPAAWRSSHPLLEARETTEPRRAAGAHRQPRAVRRLQLERPAGRLPPPCRPARPRCPSSKLEISGKRGIAAARFRSIADRRDVHPLRGQAQLRRSRAAGQSLSGELRQPASSTGWTWPTSRFENVSRQYVHASRPCCRWDRWQGCAEPLRPRQIAVRVPAVGREHPGRGRADELQGQALQVLPRCGRERADRPDGGHEGRHRERRRPIIKQLSMHIQPRPPVADHRRNHGNHRRRRGAEELITGEANRHPSQITKTFNPPGNPETQSWQPRPTTSPRLKTSAT